MARAIDRSIHPSTPTVVSLPAPSHRSFRASLKTLSASADPEHRLTLALGLHLVDREHYYKRWGFSSFATYCHHDLSIHIETARTLRLLTKELLTHAKLSPTELRQLGWTKAKILIPLARAGRLTVRTRGSILPRAIALPSDALRDWVHQTLKTSPAHCTERILPIPLTKRQATLIDQARRRVKRENGFDTVGAQLAAICAHYLQQSPTP